MPTDILRRRNPSSTTPASTRGRGRASGPRRVVIAVGRVRVRAELFETPTADRIWQALPIFSTAETWGGSIHFETPVETGRERAAVVLPIQGDICYWSEEDRVIIGFGATPIAHAGETRLPRPCNVWARALDPVTPLKSVVPGEKVTMTVG